MARPTLLGMRRLLPTVPAAWPTKTLGLAPGVLACVAVSAAAFGLQGVEAAAFGRTWLEPLVLAILIGAAVRLVWRPGPQSAPGIDFSAKTLLEAAVVLLGLTIDARTLLGVGPLLLAATAALVVLAILSSYGLGRLFRLPRRMAILIACGNSICGNSAIAAVAPVIGAESGDVTAAIAFTAVLGIGMVLGLPAMAGALHLAPRSFGVFAGLTVYAVPQVLAATAPVGLVSVQIGTVVKLLRVMMLGPVVTVLSLAAPRAVRTAVRHAPRPKLAPWFITGFLLLCGLRSLVQLPHAVTSTAATLATLLTVVAMAALGLSADARALVRAGPRVSAVVTLSLAVLSLLALALVRALSIA